MNYKIVSDSSSNVLAFSGVDFKSVPLKIITAKHEYVDNAELDVEKMVKEVKETKGKSGTSCPNIGDWLSAFEGGDIVFCSNHNKPSFRKLCFRRTGGKDFYGRLSGVKSFCRGQPFNRSGNAYNHGKNPGRNASWKKL